MAKEIKTCVKTSEKYSIAADLCGLFKFFVTGAGIFVGVITKSLWAVLGLSFGGLSLGTAGQVYFTKKAQEEKKREAAEEFSQETSLDDSDSENGEI